MKPRKKFLKSKGHWIAEWQLDLFEEIKKYMEENDLTASKFAEQLGVTKGYVSQILNGDFDHKISKLIELSLAINKAPVLTYVDLESYIEADELDHAWAGSFYCASTEYSTQITTTTILTSGTTSENAIFNFDNYAKMTQLVQGNRFVLQRFK